MKTDTATTVQQADILDQPEAKLPAVRQPRQRAVAAPVQSQPTTPMDLLRIVTERGASVAEISAFMDLMERQQANEARQAFVLAMAAFKKTAPSIYKNEGASFTAKGQQVEYDYATLGNVCEQIIAGLAEHGISHDWTLDQPNAAGVNITCTLTHEKGHSKSTTVKLPLDTTGSKNAIQSIGSTITYGERYSLLAVCGIAVKSQGDDDGRAAGGAGSTDVTLADVWIGKVKAAPTDAEAVNVWNAGAAAIEKAGDRHAYVEFKNAVAARRAELVKP